MPTCKTDPSGKLLSNTGSSAQCSVRTQRGGMGDTPVGGSFKREQAYAYSWLIHVVLQQNPTQHCEVIILQLKKNILGRGDWDGELTYIHGRFMSMYGKNKHNIVK